MLDQLANNIDNTITYKGTIKLLCDYNISYLDKLQRSKLEIVILPYALYAKNKTIPTRLNRANDTENLIDYIITNCSLINDNVICDSIVKGDHFATLSMLGLLAETKKMLVQKTFYDKKNSNVSDFKHCLEQQNWKKCTFRAA